MGLSGPYSFGECWVCCLRIILCVIWEHLKVFYPTFNLVFNVLFPEWFCPNYQSKVAFTLVSAFDSLVFEVFFLQIVLDYCLLLWGWSLQVLRNSQSLVPWPIDILTIFYACQWSDCRAIVHIPYLFHFIICSFIAQCLYQLSCG